MVVKRLVLVYVGALLSLQRVVEGSWAGSVLVMANLFGCFFSRPFYAASSCTIARRAGVDVDGRVSILDSSC